MAGGKDVVKAMRPDLPFRVYGLRREMVSTKAGKMASAGEPYPDTQVVELSPKPERGATVGIAAPWNALPRVKQIQTHYTQAVREFLESCGPREPQEKITHRSYRS
jgi:hypothetical protein